MGKYAGCNPEEIGVEKDRLQDKVIALQRALQDAIDAPKGVVPDSASQFYDYHIGAILPDEPTTPSRKREIRKV